MRVETKRRCTIAVFLTCLTSCAPSSRALAALAVSAVSIVRAAVAAVILNPLVF